MSRWDVDITRHDAAGGREQESLGTFDPEDLPTVLADALQRAADSRAGVQVRRERPSLSTSAPAA